MTAAAAATPPGAPPRDIETRGVTVVGERAVRRIAARAAREVAGVESNVQVTARVVGDATVLHVRLPIRYPLPVARITDACRAHLIERTRELSGLAVPRVDIDVTALPTDAEPGRVR